MPNSITIELTEADLVAANSLHIRLRPPAIISWAMITLAGYLIYSSTYDFTLSMIGIAMLSGGVAVLVSRTLLTPVLTGYHVRSAFRQTKSLHEPVNVEWDDQQASFHALSWSATHRWSDFTKYKESNDKLVLYLNNMSFRIIPKRCFNDAETLSDFTKLVKEKVKAG